MSFDKSRGPEAVELFAARLRDSGKFYSYYNGSNLIGKWATPKFRRKYSWAIQAATTNYMPACVSGFTDGISIAETLEGSLTSRELNSLNREFARAAVDTWTVGDSFLIVNNGRVEFQKSDTMVPLVDEENPAVLESASKIYLKSGSWHMDMMFDDHVARFEHLDFSTGKRAPKLTSQPDSWILVGEDPHDHGAVPAIWLKLEALSQYSNGRSILTDVTHIQDRTNKFIADSIIGSEAVAAPTRYFLDVVEEAGSAPDRSEVDFDDRFKDILYTSAQSGGQFAGPDVEKIIALQQQGVRDMAGVLGLVPWFMNGSAPDNVSAETVKILSRRQESRQKAFIRDNRAAIDGLLELIGVDDEFVFSTDFLDLPAVA